MVDVCISSESENYNVANLFTLTEEQTIQGGPIKTEGHTSHNMWMQ